MAEKEEGEKLFSTPLGGISPTICSIAVDASPFPKCTCDTPTRPTPGRVRVRITHSRRSFPKTAN